MRKSVLARFDGGTVPDGKARPLLTTMDRCIRHHLARAAAAFGGEDHVRTALALKVADHAAVFSKLHTDKALDLHATIDPTLVLSCEAQDLDEMLGNLLTNACKWTRKRVLVTATQRYRRIGLAIDDDGPGLSAQQAAEVISPGWRLDESSPGYGSGLPITRELVELYGGSLALAQSDLRCTSDAGPA